MFKRILVPLDGSEVAESVFPYVKTEALAHGARVILIRVIAPFRSSLMMTPALLEQATAQIRPIIESYLESTANKLRDDGILVEIVIEEGAPAERIIEYAESTGVDLILIGSRGESGLSRWRFGGVSNKVVRTRTSMPVMVVTT
jgi:nucleotide-binding universal stress UspA family protein